MLVDEQGQVLSVVRADVEQHGRTLVGPEAQGDVLSSQRRVRVDGGRQSAAVPAQLVRLLEGVADGGVRLEAGRHLWRKRRRPHKRFFFNLLILGTERNISKMEHGAVCFSSLASLFSDIKRNANFKKKKITKLQSN